MGAGGLGSRSLVAVVKEHVRAKFDSNRPVIDGDIAKRKNRSMGPYPCSQKVNTSDSMYILLMKSSTLGVIGLDRGRPSVF